MKISIIPTTRKSKNKWQSQEIHWIMVLTELRISEIDFSRGALEVCIWDCGPHYKTST